ncbi:hypothetical protein B0T21DRAFT_346032 [Apiosordaria backusii]|uniref:Uncharacterized protein n=1 Tax=Apiosordaria backusii TaxID=314023 RepID=A0AA40K1B3_9PEZI|nr:hypothetical protein B0T21DRAFT_346032 [Apiosordaria backusii]
MDQSGVERRAHGDPAAPNQLSEVAFNRVSLSEVLYRERYCLFNLMSQPWYMDENNDWLWNHGSVFRALSRLSGMISLLGALSRPSRVISVLGALSKLHRTNCQKLPSTEYPFQRFCTGTDISLTEVLNIKTARKNYTDIIEPKTLTIIFIIKRKLDKNKDNKKSL